MRRSLLLTSVFCLGLTLASNAQTKSKATARKSAETFNAKQAATDTASFEATDTNQAFGNSGNRYYIADPVVRALSQRAAGGKMPISSSGIVGMPRRAYGFANGKILLRSTTAPSSGTMYGSSSVGTGTSITGLGTGENVPGVNGKNPYAGASLWGTRPVPNQTFSVDSIKRQ